jgi:uncharacterized protein (TIGR00369 family)
MFTVPFQTLLGIELLSAGDDAAEARLTARPDLCNSRGHVHGGAIASLLDTVVGSAAAFVPAGRLPTATMNLMVTYLEPAAGDLVATARVMRRGTRVAAVEGQVLNKSGTMVAHAVGTLRLLSAIPVEGPFVASKETA